MRYIVQRNPYGKWAVVVLNPDGTTLQTSSVHATRQEALKWANMLEEKVANPSAPVKSGTTSLAPPLLRGDL